MRQKVAFSRSGGAVSSERPCFAETQTYRIELWCKSVAIPWTFCIAQRRRRLSKRGGQGRCRLVLLLKHGFPRGERFRSVVLLQLV